MKNRPLLMKTITTLSFVCLLIAFVTCQKGQTEPQTLTAICDYRSISIVNGKYRIDSTIAMSNGTKEKLVAKLESENLVEKKKTDDIPSFIKAFLDSISVNKTFDIGNPGEAWKAGGWLTGFDDQSKSIINATSCAAKPFPTKQLAYCGIGKNMAIISYYTGGIRMAQHVIILKFKGKQIVDLWFDNNSYGCISSSVLNKKDGILNFINKMNNNNC